MEIILNQTVEKVGKAGEVVKVSDGYARNYLLPKKLALPATEQNLLLAEKIKAKRQAEEEKERLQWMEQIKILEAVSCQFEVQVGEEDKMYGSVTTQDIAKFFKEAGHSVDKKQIHLKEPIKKLGEHSAEIKLSPEMTAKIQIKVIKKSS